jgi:hypothetical protein
MNRISVVIVNWNAKDYLAKCLNSLRSKSKNGFNIEILVVDNHSSDGSVKMIKDEYPEVVIIENKKNIGFGKANNQAIRKSKGDFILLLNPDTVIKTNAIEMLISYLKNNNHCGAVGPKIKNDDGTVQYECARRYPTPWTQFTVETTLYKRFPKSHIFGSYLMTYWNHLNSREVECISGACMMIRRRALDEVGLFDESFFMYGEDVDLCQRIRGAKYKIWYLAEAEIIHHQGKSSEQTPFKMALIARESMVKYFLKHNGLHSVLLYKAMIVIACCMIIPISLSLVLIDKTSKRNKIIFRQSLLTLLWVFGFRAEINAK